MTTSTISSISTVPATVTSAAALAAWALVAGRVAYLGARRRAAARTRDQQWHPHVSSGCGR